MASKAKVIKNARHFHRMLLGHMPLQHSHMLWEGEKLKAQPTASLPVLEVSHLQVCALALPGHSADAAWSTDKVASPRAAQIADP